MLLNDMLHSIRLLHTFNNLLNNIICVGKFRKQFVDEEVSRDRLIFAKIVVSILDKQKKYKLIEDRNFTYIILNKSVNIWCVADGVR